MKITDNIFEDYKHFDDEQIEYWYARELQELLQYKEWRNFNKIIQTAKLLARLVDKKFRNILLKSTK